MVVVFIGVTEKSSCCDSQAHARAILCHLSRLSTATPHYLPVSLQNMVDQAGRRLSPSFLRSLLAFCDQHLEHSEPRVRSLVAGTLGSLTKAGNTKGTVDTDAGVGEQEAAATGEQAECTGLAVYRFFRERLLGAISSNFERTKDTITTPSVGLKTWPWTTRLAGRLLRQAYWRSRYILCAARTKHTRNSQKRSLKICSTCGGFAALVVDV